jgi:signal transduction histidine kinase
MLELSMHILDIVQNSLRAKASRVEVRIREDREKDRLIIEVEDNGQGMPPETVKRVTDPFYTTRPTRVAGLGVPLLKEAAEKCGGHLEVHSREGEGTRIMAEFQLDHFTCAGPTPFSPLRNTSWIMPPKKPAGWARRPCPVTWRTSPTRA